jgi:uncharacterized protein (DUF302 family)
LVFGNPKAGTFLIQAEQAIGLDLPLKALAWEDAAGAVWLAYTDVAALARRYRVGGASQATVVAIGRSLAAVADVLRA